MIRKWISLAGLAAVALLGTGCEEWIFAVADKVKKDRPAITTGNLEVSWKVVPKDSKANDISVGSDGTVYRVGTAPRPGGYTIDRYLGDGKWQTEEGGAVKLAVKCQGKYLIVTSEDSLKQVVGGAATFLGLATDATWKNDDLYIAETEVYHPWIGYYITKPVNEGWVRLDGAAHRVAVGPNGDLWAINYRSYEIYRKKPGNLTAWDWETLPGLGMEVTVTFDGTVYLLGTDKDAEGNYGINKWDQATYSWKRVQNRAVKIAGGPGRTLWAVKADKSIVYSSNPPLQ